MQFLDDDECDMPENIDAASACRRVEDLCFARLLHLFDIVRVLLTCQYETVSSSGVQVTKLSRHHTTALCHQARTRVLDL